jgi:hypothetical protein
MKEFFDIVAKWDHFGQGLFFLISLSMLFGAIVGVARYLAIMIQGWPPPGIN